MRPPVPPRRRSRRSNAPASKSRSMGSVPAPAPPRTNAVPIAVPASPPIRVRGRRVIPNAAITPAVSAPAMGRSFAARPTIGPVGYHRSARSAPRRRASNVALPTNRAARSMAAAIRSAGGDRTTTPTAAPSKRIARAMTAPISAARTTSPAAGRAPAAMSVSTHRRRALAAPTRTARLTRAVSTTDACRTIQMRPANPVTTATKAFAHPCAGGFASADGITCERCGPGTAAPAGSAQCQECDPGYYTDDSENDECNNCPPGWYASESGSTECTECPLGTFSDTNAATVCTPCPAGTYTEHVMSTECIACDCEAGSMPEVCGCLPATCVPGQYLAESECVACSAGTYSDLPDSVFCKPCDLNTYQDLPGQSSCVACTEGFYTESVGALECTECNCALGDMPLICDCDTPCEAGYAPDGFGMCAACDEGSASFDGSVCVPCAAGSFASGAANLQCTPCAAGTYSDDIGAGICDACPAGSFASSGGATGCSPCSCGETCSPVTGTCGSVGVGGACSSNAECASDVCGCGSPPGLPECMCRFDTCWATGVECASGSGAVSCCEGDCLCTGGGCFCTAAG